MVKMRPKVLVINCISCVYSVFFFFASALRLRSVTESNAQQPEDNRSLSVAEMSAALFSNWFILVSMFMSPLGEYAVPERS